MRRNKIAVLALVLALLGMALTGLSWLDQVKKLQSQAGQLDQLTWQVERLAEQLAQQAAAEQVEFLDYSLEARAWADGTGADVTLRAVPERYEEDLEVVFIVENGTDAWQALCQWDGEAYTATAGLEAANNYCYYLAAGDGEWITLAASWGNYGLECVYLADSLEGYATFELQGWQTEAGELTLQRGLGLVQLPLFDSEGRQVTAQSCQFRLKQGEQTLSSQVVQPVEGEAQGCLEIVVQELTFPVPELEEGQQVELWLEAELSNDRTLTAWICGWTMSGGQLGQVAG